MSINPYETPNAQVAYQPKPNKNRSSALLNVRVALLILLVPAIYNFICFSYPSNTNRIELPIYSVYRTFNSIGLVLVVLVIWFLGLVALEFITGGAHSVWARKSKLDDWKTILYLTLRQAPAFAACGAVLWAIWVAAFYQLDVSFFIISVPIGTAAHLLAAGFYVPMIYRWYKVENEPASQTTT